MSARHRPLAVKVERLPELRLREFVSFGAVNRGGATADWAAAPGHVDRRVDDMPCRLHFAPRRWLVVGDDAELQTRIDAACDAGVGRCVDVDGKWVALKLVGPDARPALASTVDIDAVLEGRGCAAVTLFDCPAVIVRDDAGYRLWVTASYVQAFEAAIGRLAA